jgi:hypothetical protein
MRAISIYEAVRSRQLTPEALIELLKSSEPDGPGERCLPEAPNGDGADTAKADRSGGEI